MAKKRKFPTTQAGKLALAQEMANGFEENVDVYPKPITDVAAQKARINSVQAKISAVTQIEAARRAAVRERDDEIELMEDEMTENIDYAELVAKGDDAKLRLINWSGRAEPKAQQKPGQPRVLEIIKQGAGWFQGDWKEPSDGGSVQSYRIMRRVVKEGGDMREAGSSIVSDAILVEQPRGVELEYAVVAVNKAGESEPSNSITITL
jgi:hypothetical protein